jgi:hypothetical protein
MSKEGDGRHALAGLPGIAHDISGGQWEQYVGIAEERASDDTEKYEQVGSSSSVGMERVQLISARYAHDDFIRLRPRLALKDIDEAMIMPIINQDLADKVSAIHVYANGYKLHDIQCEDFRIDATAFDPSIPVEFSEDELADPWVRIRPTSASVFSLSFYERTPKRLFSSPETVDTLSLPRRPKEGSS